MATRMQQRRGTAAQWTAANPVLAAGEIGFETDNNRFKIGNGATAWTALDYFANSAALTDLIGGAPELLNTLEELADAIGDDANFFTTVSTNLSNHTNATENVHGITNTALLATTAQVETAAGNASTDLSNHNSATTDVHGIADTSVLATTEYVDNALSTATGDYPSLAGVGLAWNVETEALDVDATIATVGSLTDHTSATTDVHGIADTAALATTADTATAIETAVTGHNDLTLTVHGIADTSVLETVTGSQDKADAAVSTHNAVTLNVHGISDTSELETQTGAQSKADLAQGAAENYADLLVGDVTVDGTAGNTVTDRIASAEDYTDSQIDAHVAVTTNVHGIADTSKIVLSDAVSTTLDGALIITGDLTVNGSEFIASATSITIEDNLVQLAHQNAANTVDLGLVVAYNDGSSKHAGIARDVSDAKWKLFKDVATEPSTTVAFGEGSLDDLAVNNVEVAGVVFTDGTQTKEGVPSRTPIIQKTASYELSTLTHRDSMIEISSTSGTTLTIPADSSVDYPIGTTVDILQTNTGQVTVAGAAGVTVNATPGLKLRTRWSSATLMKRAADTWVVYGDLTA